MTRLDDGHQHGAKQGRHGDQHCAQEAWQGSAGGIRRIEVITGQARRRHWPVEEKARITALSLEPGVNVSEVARRNGVSIGLLHYWRRQAKAGGGSDDSMGFVPVYTEAGGSGGAPSSVGQIELELNGVRIRVSGRIDQASLICVLSAVRAAG